jgi:hypothetical protein
LAAGFAAALAAGFAAVAFGAAAFLATGFFSAASFFAAGLAFFSAAISTSFAIESYEIQQLRQLPPACPQPAARHDRSLQPRGNAPPFLRLQIARIAINPKTKRRPTGIR